MALLSLIFIMSFLTVGLFVVGLMMKGERSILSERVDAIKHSMQTDAEELEPELAKPISDRVLRPWLDKVAASFGRFVPGTAVANVAAKLDSAGNPGNLHAAEFIGLKITSIVVFAVGGIALALTSNSQPAVRVLAIILGAVIGGLLPDAILERAIQERHMAIRKSLSDCLDLLVVSVEAGLAFEAALAQLVERSRGPLPDEFRKVLRDISVGASRLDALRSMATRVNLPELTTFVAAMRQATMLGISTAQVLRVQAQNIRVQRHLRARESAAKLPVKLLFPLVFFIFPSIFIVILAPGVMQLLSALGGK